MLKLLNMEFFRLKKSKCTYVILIIAIFLSLLNPAMYKLMDTLVTATGSETEISEMQEEAGGIQLFKSHWTASEMVMQNISGLNILLLVAIFTVIFVNGEMKNGYIKNLVGYIYKRRRLVISNAIVVAVYTIILMIVGALVSAGATYLLFDGTTFGDAGEFFGYFSTQTLLHVSFSLLVLMFTYITRSTAIPMVIGIALSSGIGTLIYGLATMALQKIADISDSFYLGNYTVTGNIVGVSLNAESSDIIRAVVTAVVFAVVFVTVGCFVTEKRDLK